MDYKDSMKLSRLIYWISLLLLILGGRVLIDPSNRTIGETIQIYITLIAFEVYMWLLLMLARWQWRKGLGADVARSGLFAIGLQGLMYVALNELHMASTTEGLILAIVVTGLAGAKLYLTKRWLQFQLPNVLLGCISCSVLIMLISGIVFRNLPQGSSQQQTASFVFCWITAVLVAAHGLIAAWKQSDIQSRVHSGELWWVSWLVSCAFCVMVLIQLFSIRRGFFVDFPLAFFMPILAAAAVSAVVLSIARDKHQLVAWLFLLVCFLIMLAVNKLPDEPETQASWMSAAGGGFVHPLYPAGVLAAVLAIVTGVKLRSKALLILGIGLFLLAGVFRLLLIFGPAMKDLANRSIKWCDNLIKRILEWRHAQGVLLLAAAFLTLGLGAWLQRRAKLRTEIQQYQTPPIPVPEEEISE